MNGQEMAYDPAIQAVVLFGGYDGSGLSGTWAFSSTGWTQLAPKHSPPSENLGAMTYDASDHYLVLFGGNEPGLGNTGPTWTFSHGDWRAVLPSLSPSGRANAMMAYDAADGYVVLFGGAGPADTNYASVPLGDTWTYHAGVWTNISATLTTTPSPRWGGAMAYDPSLGAVVLFGGCSFETCDKKHAPSNDLWEFKGGQWTNITPTTGFAPAARWGAGIAYDPNVAGVILFGGERASGSLPDTTWELQGTQWARVHPTASSPAPRFRARMTFDASAGEIVLFAGGLSPAYLDDTWALH